MYHIHRTLLIAALCLAALFHSFGCAPAPIHLRVLTYNIHHGQGTDGKFDLPRIADIIKQTNPDLVALQEVDQNTGRSSGVDQAAELAKLTGMHAAFGKAMDYDGGQYGEAILSRFPIKQTTNHPLPYSPGHEPRAAIAITTKLSRGPPITFIGTHFDHTRDPTDRIAQAKKLAELYAGQSNPPVILAGDLNATTQRRPLQILLQHFTDADSDRNQPTMPSVNPRRRIDYILFRPADRFRIIETRVIKDKIASDHCPVLVVLQYLPPAH